MNWGLAQKLYFFLIKKLTPVCLSKCKWTTAHGGCQSSCTASLLCLNITQALSCAHSWLQMPPCHPVMFSQQQYEWFPVLQYTMEDGFNNRQRLCDTSMNRNSVTWFWMINPHCLNVRIPFRLLNGKCYIRFSFILLQNYDNGFR